MLGVRVSHLGPQPLKSNDFRGCFQNKKPNYDFFSLFSVRWYISSNFTRAGPVKIYAQIYLQAPAE